MSLIQSIDYAAIAPPVVLVVTGLIVLVTDLFVPVARRTVAAPIAVVGSVAYCCKMIPLAAVCEYTGDRVYVAFLQPLFQMCVRDPCAL